MQNLTQDGQQLVNNLSQKYNLSVDAVIHMLIAVNNGAGSMAQFNCPELGGGGQWMRGGMTMVGDMFNYGLKNTVDNLCNELANGLANCQVFVPIPKGTPGSNQWWPGDLGQPFSSGAQNNIRYAVFPNRLAVELNGQVTVYNTLDNNISGVSQQQGGDTSLTFSSQYGTIAVNSLPIVSGVGIAPTPQRNFAEPTQNSYAPTNHSQTNNQTDSHLTQTNNAPQHTNLPGTTSIDETLQIIEKLAKLKDAGAISENEYNSKKTELLNRI
ncbi:SHOCT domain-containing protein [Marinomonas pollencensis]|uniref:Putative oligomerization/nucleic acid binding protein n=1 Tax=Marinomonas pollencensis TaxID=491954 RepID=A0A3E0DNL3_9GAMM|nr:SHOCT domain-containing protein [Marinomonas pollencensis]REG84303.1 putative oligomerization/nucleic acid binding protein [Marinomonas pollencensis]